jgi:hypothetical protein
LIKPAAAATNSETAVRTKHSIVAEELNLLARNVDGARSGSVDQLLLCL